MLIVDWYPRGPIRPLGHPLRWEREGPSLRPVCARCRLLLSLRPYGCSLVQRSGTRNPTAQLTPIFQWPLRLVEDYVPMSCCHVIHRSSMKINHQGTLFLMMVVIVCALCGCCNAFNVDLKSRLVHRGEGRSMFGYDVDMYQGRSGVMS
ncbi:unnamed protein product [Soboliphyme baturini]|uniref:LITAF domain-containing protein n=1 Tax=Soboliphyme baturini TaxID=241478 RepID=A0A183J765_9BILA|nr:unnamed protein product [Soboliphyme baturini]